MSVNIKFPSKDKNIIISNTYEVNMKMIIAEGRKKDAREDAKKNGPSWLSNGITLFAKKYIEKVNEGCEDDVIELSVINLMIIVWLNENIFYGLTEEDLFNKNFEILISNNGQVAITHC